MNRVMLFSGTRKASFASVLLVAGFVGSGWAQSPADRGLNWGNGNSPFRTPGLFFADTQPKGDPTIDNPYWTRDPFKGTPAPKLNNPYWTTDPLKGTPVPKLSNPYWTRDPFKGTPVPKLNNPYWTTDPFKGRPAPKLGSPY